MHLVECHTHGTSWLCLCIQMNHGLPSIHAFGWVSHTRDILAVSLYTNKPRFAFYPCIWLSVTHTGHPGCVSVYNWAMVCLLSLHLVECHTHGTSWLCLCIQMNHGLPSIHAFGWVSHTRDILAVSLYTIEPWFAFYPCIWLSVTHTGHPGCVSVYKWTTVCLLSMHLVECHTHGTSWLCLCIQLSHGLPSILAFGWVSHTRDILAMSLYTNEPRFAFYPCIWLSVTHTCHTHGTSWLCLYIQMNHGLPSIHAFGWVSHTRDILAVSLYTIEPWFAFYPCIWLSVKHTGHPGCVSVYKWTTVCLLSLHLVECHTHVSHTRDILAVSLYTNEPRFAFYPCIWLSVTHTGHPGCVSVYKWTTICLLCLHLVECHTHGTSWLCLCIQMNHGLPSILAFGWVSHTRDIVAVSLYTNEPRFAFYPCIWLSVTHTGHPGCVSVYKWTTICLLSLHLVQCHTHGTSWLCLCIQMNHGLPSILAFGWVSHTRDILAVSLYTNEPRFAFYPCIWLSVTHTGHPGCVSIYKWTTVCLLSLHLVECHIHGTSWLCLYIQMNHDLPSIHAFGWVSHTRDILAVSLYTNEPRFAFYPCIWFSVTHTCHTHRTSWLCLYIQMNHGLPSILAFGSVSHTRVTHTGHPGCVSIYKWTTICLLSLHLVQCHTHGTSWLCLYIQMNHDLPSILAFGSVSHTRDILAVSLYTNEPRFAFYPCIWFSVTHTGHPGCVSIYKWTTVCLLSLHLVECHTHGTSWLCLCIQMNHGLPFILAFGSVSHTQDILAVSLYTNEPRFAFYPCIWFSVTHTGHPGCVSIYKWIMICLLSLHLVQCHTPTGHPGCVSIYKWIMICLLSLHLVQCHTHGTSWLCLYILLAFGSVSHTRDILAVSLYTNESWFAFSLHLFQCHTHGTSWLCLYTNESWFAFYPCIWYTNESWFAFYPCIWLSVSHTFYPCIWDILAVSLYTNESWFAFSNMNHDLPCIWLSVTHTGHPGCVSIYKWIMICLLSLHLIECLTRDILAVSLYTNESWFAFYPCIWLSVTHTGHPGCVSIYKWIMICLLSLHLIECHTHTGYPGCVSVYKWTTVCLLSLHLVQCHTHGTSWLCLYIQMNHDLPSILAFDWVSHTYRISWLCLCIQMNHGLPSILAFGSVSHTRDILAVSLYRNEPWFAFYPCIWLSVSHTQDILAVSLYTNEPRFAFYPRIWLSVTHTHDILAVSLYTNEPINWFIWHCTGFIVVSSLNFVEIDLIVEGWCLH